MEYASVADTLLKAAFGLMVLVLGVVVSVARLKRLERSHIYYVDRENEEWERNAREIRRAKYAEAQKPQDTDVTFDCREPQDAEEIFDCRKPRDAYETFDAYQ